MFDSMILIVMVTNINVSIVLQFCNRSLNLRRLLYRMFVICCLLLLLLLFMEDVKDVDGVWVVSDDDNALGMVR